LVELIPDWKDTSIYRGTMVRSALWLIQMVGVGGVFTKEGHRDAFPEISQADRRLRDLRKYGWIVNTSVEDLSLNQNEQRFVARGLDVWVPTARRSVVTSKITAKQRMKVFAENNYQCCICGIAGGESYFDSPALIAVLSAVKKTSQVPGASESLSFSVECNRCSSGKSKSNQDISKFTEKISQLSEPEKLFLVDFLSSANMASMTKLVNKFLFFSQSSQAIILKLI
jgi:hypothetical protein